MSGRAPRVLVVGTMFSVCCMTNAAVAQVAPEEPVPPPVAPAPPAAAGPEARIEVGAGHTDNLNHDAAEIDSSVDVVGVAFSANRKDQGVVRGAIKGDLQYLMYGAAGLVEDHEVLGSVDGALELHIVPDRFQWGVRYDYGQVRADPREAVGPTNRLRSTTATTGPTVLLPLGDRNSLEIAAEVADRHFESQQNLDSQLTTTRLAVRRMINPTARIGLVFEHSDNEFDALADEYSFKITSLEYRKELASGLAGVSVGRGSVEIAGVSESTTVARVNWNRALGTRSRLEIWGGRELTDAGSLFTNGTVVGQGPLSGLAEAARTTDDRLRGVALTRSPLRRQSLGVRFAVDGPEIIFTASLAGARDRFETDTFLNNDATTTLVTAAHPFGQRWRGEVSVSRWDQNFVSGRSSVDDTVRLSMARLIGRASHVALALEHNRRESELDPFSEKAFRVTFGRDFRR